MRNCLIAGLLSLALFSCGKSPEEKLLALYKTGVQQVDRYEFDNALATFKEVGEIDPSSPLGYYGTGLVFERQLQYYEALHIYMSTTNADPSFAPAFAGVWRMFTQLEQWEDAVQAAAEYARLLPDDPEAHFTFAKALMKIGQYSRARQEVDGAIDAGADRALAGIIKAWAYRLEHKVDSAEAAYEEAMAESHGSPQLYDEIAAYFESAGLIDSAISMGRKSVEKAGNDFVLTAAQFFRALKYNYLFEARMMIHRLKEQGAPELITTGLDMFYHLARGNQPDARRACDVYGRLSLQGISALVYDMVVRGEEEDLLTGIKNISAITYIMETNNFDKEFQDYMKYMLAVLFAGYFDDLEGLRQLEQVPAAFSNRMEVRLRNAYCLYRTGQHEKYKQQMALLSKYHSSQPNWLTGMADIYADRFVREYEKADQYYRLALKEDKWHRSAFENAVQMYRRLKQPKKALGFFAAYPYFEDSYAEISLLKALCLVEDDAIKQGVDLFEKSFSLVRGDLVKFKKITSLLERKDRQEERTRLFNLLLQINSDNVDALLLAADFKYSHDDFETGLNLAEKAQSLEPGNVTASVYVARGLYGLGQRSKAFDIFERNLVEAHYNVDNNYYFSRILATEQIDVKRAANLARRAVFDSQHDLKVWMNLSYVYYMIGRYDFSRGEALKATRSHRTEPEPFFRLGMAMYKEGKEEAKENLEKAIELGLIGEDLKTARQVLQELKDNTK